MKHLNQDKITKIRESEGLQKSIAAKFGVSIMTVSSIKRNPNYGIRQKRLTQIERDRRQSKGVCITCKTSHSESTRLCSSCKEKYRLYANTQRERRAREHKAKVDAGLCSFCYKDTRTGGFKTCLNCRVKSRLAQRKLKEEVKQAYGGKCACCGEVDTRFLTIDHINDDGADHRRQMRPGGRGCGGKIYTILKKEGFPEGYRLLCWNCNSGRSVNGGKCPHADPEPDMLLAAAGII